MLGLKVRVWIGTNDFSLPCEGSCRSNIYCADFLIHVQTWCFGQLYIEILDTCSPDWHCMYLPIWGPSQAPTRAQWLTLMKAMIYDATEKVTVEALFVICCQTFKLRLTALETAWYSWGILLLRSFWLLSFFALHSDYCLCSTFYSPP